MMQSTERKAMLRTSILALAVSVVALLALAASAGAARRVPIELGGTGEGAGKFNRPRASRSTTPAATSTSSTARTSESSSSPRAAPSSRAWGFDVVASGEDDKPFANEVQRIQIKASSGTFKLNFAGTTPALPYNATATEVETALDNLVSRVRRRRDGHRGARQRDGQHPVPRHVRRRRPRRGRNAADPARPDRPRDPGRHAAEMSGSPFEVGFFLPTPADHSNTSGSPMARRSRGRPPTPSSPPPPRGARPSSAVPRRCSASRKPWSPAGRSRSERPRPGHPPARADEHTQPGQSGTLTVAGPGGQTLTCNAGSWQNSPTSFTYQWYRNGAAIGTPTTTAATSNQYVVTAADVSDRAVFQCSVTGENAFGKSTTISGARQTSPAPGPPNVSNPTVTVTSGTASSVLTPVEGGPVFEVCKANPPSNDVCKAGAGGPSTGQFSAPRGIAVDNSPGGNGAIYVVDDQNLRVQKFTSTGTPILMFGKAVNKITGGNLCTVASGESAAPASSTGAGNRRLRGMER